jgi:hypothetical protein
LSPFCAAMPTSSGKNVPRSPSDPAISWRFKRAYASVRRMWATACRAWWETFTQRPLCGGSLEPWRHHMVEDAEKLNVERSCLAPPPHLDSNLEIWPRASHRLPPSRHRRAGTTPACVHRYSRFPGLTLGHDWADVESRDARVVAPARRATRVARLSGSMGSARTPPSPLRRRLMQKLLSLTLATSSSPAASPHTRQ